MLHIMSFATTGTEGWLCNTVVTSVQSFWMVAQKQMETALYYVEGGAVVHQSPAEKMQKRTKASGLILAF